MADVLSNPHLQDLLFVFFASQLSQAVLPGPRTQAFLRQTFAAPALIFAFVLLKNGAYTSNSALWSAIVACAGAYLYKRLP